MKSKKSRNLYLSGVTGTFLNRGPPIVQLDRARLGLSRTVFRVFGMSKLTRLDSRHMCGQKVYLHLILSQVSRILVPLFYFCLYLSPIFVQLLFFRTSVSRAKEITTE